MSKPKYNIGDSVYWVDSSCHSGHKISCPMCFKTGKVTIILGDGSHVDSECGFCSHGLERATGLAHAWGPQATVVSGEVQGVFRADSGWKYQCGYNSLDEYELFTDRVEAEKKQVLELEKVTKQGEQWFKESFKQAKKSQIWNAGYHKSSIKDAERTISWHKARLCMIEERAAK